MIVSCLLQERNKRRMLAAGLPAVLETCMRCTKPGTLLQRCRLLATLLGITEVRSVAVAKALSRPGRGKDCMGACVCVCVCVCVCCEGEWGRHNSAPFVSEAGERYKAQKECVCVCVCVCVCCRA